MSDSPEVTWERQTIDVTNGEAWRRFEPTGTTELTCTCGWVTLVPDTDVQKAGDDHHTRPAVAPS